MRDRRLVRHRPREPENVLEGCLVARVRPQPHAAERWAETASSGRDAARSPLLVLGPRYSLVAVHRQVAGPHACRSLSSTTGSIAPVHVHALLEVRLARPVFEALEAEDCQWVSISLPGPSFTSL